MTLLRGFSIMMGANVALLALAFLNNKIIYVYLDPEANGVYFLAARLALFIALLFGDWLRLSTFNIAGGDRTLRGPLSANILWYSIGLGCVLALPAALILPSVGIRLFDIPPYYTAAAAAIASFYVLRDSSQSLLLVSRRESKYGMTILAFGTIFLALDFVLVVLSGFGLSAVVFAWMAAAAVSAVYAYASNAADTGLHLRPSGSLFARSGSLGGRAFIGVAGMFLMTNVHTFAIEPLSVKTGAGLLLVAIFSVCFRISQLFQRVADVAGTLLLSHVVGDERETGFLKTARTARAVFLFSTAAALFCLVAGKYLVLLVADSKYLSATVPLLFMLPGMVAVTTGSVLNTYYWGNNYPAGVIAWPFAAAAFGLALDVVLIPRMGVSGATLAFTATNLIWAAWIVARFLRDSGLPPSALFIPEADDIRRAASVLRLRGGTA